MYTSEVMSIKSRTKYYDASQVLKSKSMQSTTSITSKPQPKPSDHLNSGYVGI